MAVNLDKPHLWKADIARSVDMYNQWFLRFAPKTFRETRVQTTRDVEATLRVTKNLTDVDSTVLRKHPSVLPTLRMSTCPPLAADRLIGLSGVPKSLVDRMEKTGKLPVRLRGVRLDVELDKIGSIIEQLADPDIFVWLNRDEPAMDIEIHRAATIVADRLCGSVANPIIRNAQEKRQLAKIKAWLEARNYRELIRESGARFDAMPLGTFAFRMNVLGTKENGTSVNIPVDAVVMPKGSQPNDLPILFEAKSAGDFANVNKRRKEEANKLANLSRRYGEQLRFVLFLCGYFDSGYLGYAAADGIDWVWEHRIDDLAKLGL